MGSTDRVLEAFAEALAERIATKVAAHLAAPRIDRIQLVDVRANFTIDTGCNSLQSSGAQLLSMHASTAWPGFVAGNGGGGSAL